MNFHYLIIELCAEKMTKKLLQTNVGLTLFG